MASFHRIYSQLNVDHTWTWTWNWDDDHHHSWDPWWDCEFVFLWGSRVQLFKSLKSVKWVHKTPH